MPKGHWTDQLFLDHSEIFLQIHEHGWADGEEQSRELKALLDRFGVATGASILDVPCGIGRHSTRLARMGYRTLGLDLSPGYVRRAQERAREEGVADRATYRVGDMRDLGRSVSHDERPFDVAMNLWTSLGYYGEATDLAILEGYRDLVRSGGLMILYVVNRDWVVRHFDPQGYEEFGDLVHIEDRRLDLEASWMRNRWRFFRKRGEDLEGIATIALEHRIYSVHELEALFDDAGWRVEGAFAGFTTSPATFEAPSVTIVGRK